MHPHTPTREVYVARVGSVLRDWTPIVLLHNVLRGLSEPLRFRGNDMSVIGINEEWNHQRLFLKDIIRRILSASWGRTVLIAAIVDFLITFSTKTFIVMSIASKNTPLVIFSVLLFAGVGPVIYVVLFGEPLSWVEFYNDGYLFRAITTIGFYKIRKWWWRFLLANLNFFYPLYTLCIDGCRMGKRVRCLRLSTNNPNRSSTAGYNLVT